MLLDNGYKKLLTETITTRTMQCNEYNDYNRIYSISSGDVILKMSMLIFLIRRAK